MAATRAAVSLVSMVSRDLPQIARGDPHRLPPEAEPPMLSLLCCLALPGLLYLTVASAL